MAASVQNGIFIRTCQDVKRDLRLSGFTSLQCLRVCNQSMLIAINNRTLVQRSLVSSVKPKEIQLPIPASDSVDLIHLSPNGFHAVISCKSGDNFYVHNKHTVAVPLKKIKEKISAVGWNPECLKDTETGNILLGTQSGSIIETNIASTGAVSFVKEHLSVFGRDIDRSTYISDISIHVINDDDPKAVKMVVLICQPDRLHYLYAPINMAAPPRPNYMSTASLHTFVALPETPQHIFHPFFGPKEAQIACMCMPSSPVPDNSSHSSKTDVVSQLILCPSRGDTSQPFRFVWLGPSGYTIGKVNLSAEKPRDIVTEDIHKEHSRIEGRIECPIGVSMTEYHILLAYSTRVVAVSLYTYDVVYEDIWQQAFGLCLGLTFDPISEFHWLYTSTTTMKYRSNDEERYVWRVFLERDDYARALSIATKRISIEPQAHELVLKRQADKHIAEKNFTAAAEILSQSSESFETLVLKFLSTEEDRRMGLKTLLEKKLDRMTSGEDRMRRDALVMWLLEVQLAELAELRREGKETEELNTQLQRFLTKKTIHESIATNQTAIYGLMVSHADFDTQLFLALHLRDFGTAINIYLLREKYKDILEILKNQQSSEAFYRYSSLLVPHIPMELFAYLMNKENIRPQKMISTLCLCQNDAKMAMPAMKYIEWAISTPSGRDVVSLHNMLILMYAKFRPKKLHQYLVSAGGDKNAVPYNLDFAIRTCEQYKLENSIIYLYCVSELFAEAVEMALKISVDMAKQCAHLMDASEDDVIMGIEPKYPKEQRRRIWLRIAQFVLEKEGDAEKCIDLLKESQDAISIQDIFPFFPEFTKIEHFKDSLCNCLKDHSNVIQDIQQSLRDATETAQEIRERTDRLKHRVTVVKAGDHCAGCKRSLAGRPFYPFSCRHFYHRECLETTLKPHLSLESQGRLSHLMSRERCVLAQLEIEEKSTTSTVLADREAEYQEISSKISDILGKECPLCGFMAIELVDQSFFTDVDYANDLDSWMI